MENDPIRFLRAAFSSGNASSKEEFLHLLDSSRSFFEKLHFQIKRAKAEDKRLLLKALFQK